MRALGKEAERDGRGAGPPALALQSGRGHAPLLRHFVVILDGGEVAGAVPPGGHRDPAAHHPHGGPAPPRRVERGHPLPLARALERQEAHVLQPRAATVAPDHHDSLAAAERDEGAPVLGFSAVALGTHPLFDTIPVTIATEVTKNL